MRTEDNIPQVSVLMGVRYRRKDLFLLERAVKSILNQTFTDFEFLICDGGSSPEACQLLDAFAASDSRVRLLRDSALPTDLAHKLNACLRAATGAWIVRMDDDDFSRPERFEKQLDYLAAHSEIAFAGCNVTLCRAGEQIGTRCFPEYPQVRDFFFTQPFIHPALIFRREALLAVGGYSEGKHQVLCEDYDLLLRLYAAGYRGANLQESLFDYTVSETVRGNRTMRHRWNESVTRYERFRELGVLPQALPCVVKPLAVGLLPVSVLEKWKKRSQSFENSK